jgi:4-amino-4-deoxy-L-arabinose transferase-like glycosyltransferase
MIPQPLKIADEGVDNYLFYFLILLLFTLITATIILGSVPPVDRDGLTHHLYIPKLWLQHGGIYEIPKIPFSYYPMNLDLLYTIPLYFGNDIIPKYIHYFFALLTALLLYWHLKKRLGRNYGILGALFFLSVPIIVKLSITVYVDLGVVFFTTAALMSLLHWAENNFSVRFLVLAGSCCGLAAGTKYNGLIAIAVFTLLVPIIYQQNAPKEKQSNSKALRSGLIFAFVTLATFSPWLMKNYMLTGNPIYPLHNSLFQKLDTPNTDQQFVAEVKTTDTPQQLTSKNSNAFISRKILYNETWWQALLLPVRFFLEGQDDNPQFFDGKLTPFLLLLPALAFLRRPSEIRQRLEQRFLLLFAIL